MTRQAKITLVADVAAFKSQVEKAKTLLSDLGSVKVDPSFSSSMRQVIGQNVTKMAAEAEDAIEKLQKGLKEMGQEHDKAFDPEKASAMVKQLAEYKRKLQEVKNIETQMKGPGSGGPGDGGLEDAPKRITPSLMQNFARFMKSGSGQMLGLAGMLGLSIGVGSLIQRQRQISRERLEYTPFTGGAQGDMFGSTLGFTPEERRARFLDIGRGMGRDMDDSTLNRVAGMGESFQRAFGISSQEQGQALGVGRRAGGEGDKFFAGVIGAAVVAGLDGSRVSEFLAAISESTASMSEGINIRTDSLAGMAGAFSRLPFFAKDPRRSTAALEGMDQAFKNGDRFQQAQSFRAIQGAAMARGANPQGMTAGGLEFRRQMGLFGQLTPQALGTISGMQGGGKDLAKILSTSPEEILNNIFNEARDTTKGFNAGQRLLEFKERTGMSTGASAEIFTALERGEKLSPAQIKKFKDSQFTPEERIDKTFQGLDKSMANLGQTIESAADKMAATVGGAAADMVKALGLNSDRLASLGIGLMGVTTALSTLSGVLAIMGAAKALGGGGGIPGVPGGAPGVPGGGLSTLAKGGALAAAGVGGFMLGPTIDEATGGFIGKGFEKFFNIFSPDTEVEDEKVREKQRALHEKKQKPGKKNIHATDTSGIRSKPYALDMSKAPRPPGLPPLPPVDAKTSAAMGVTPDKPKTEAEKNQTAAFDTAPFSENSRAVGENTQALRELTRSLQSGRSSGGIIDRRPSGSMPLDNRSVGR